MFKAGLAWFRQKVSHRVKEANKDTTRQIEVLKADIEKAQDRINNAKQLMLDGQISAVEYREFKEQYEDEISNCESKTSQILAMSAELKNQIDFCFDLVLNLPKYYAEGDLQLKQEIVGSL